MGARQSKRSVDITTTPKKEGLPVEGVVGDAAAPGDGKLEKIEETDAKPTTNGTAVHTDATPEDKDKDKDEATEKEKEDETKAEDAKVESPTEETPAEGAAEVTTPTEGTPASPTTATSPESKETKKKEKLKKKWSFRSISFGKKDKSKPAREDAPKNGDVTKEEPLAEGGEEAEAAAASSPVDEKSAVSSPTDKEQSGTEVAAAAAVPEAKVEEDENKSSSTVAAPAAAPVASSPAEEKKEESSTPAPTPVPVEAKKVEEIEKEVEPANADKKVEVSPVQAVIEAPVEVNSQSKQIATTTTTAPSIIERKTSEDFPSQFPSSPPPTPIDPSPLQQAQQVAENASAIAEALKLPAEAANKASIAYDKSVSITHSASPTSSWRVETSSVSPNTLESEKSTQPTSSESPEQTGNASPLPIIGTITDTMEKSSAVLESSDIRVTEKNTAEEVERTVDVESDKTGETDLVIMTEEGPASVSGDVLVEAKPAAVIPDSPAEEIESVPVSLEPENKLDNEESVPKHVESKEVVDRLENGNVETEQSLNQSHSEPVTSMTQENLSINEEIPEKDMPPPLPDSPIPVPKATSQLLNFMSTQIEDSPVIMEVIDSAKNLTLAAEEVVCPLMKKVVDIPEIDETFKETEESKSYVEESQDSSSSLPPPVEITESRIDQVSELVEDDDLPPAPQEPLEQISQSVEENVDVTIEATISNSAVSPDASIPDIPAETTILTPPRSPSPDVVSNPSGTDITAKDSSHLDLLDADSNREFKMESVEESLNSYNDSELELKERLADSVEDNTSVNWQLSNAVQENDQSKTEPEAPVENNIVMNNGTTEVNDEAPKSPPPAVPAEVPVPILGPAITEDVASVTKAIEEIDINEKAVAAAVNENIESANTNEIIADMNHQNNMNE